MFNPLSDTNAPISSRIALYGALLLAGIFGLGAAVFLPVKNFRTESSLLEKVPDISKPSLAATLVNSAPELPRGTTDDLVKFCADNVNESRSFVVFRTGTAVIVNEPCEDPVAEALEKLATCSAPDVRFVSEPTREGELIVAFREPVFHRFGGGELSELTLWLANNACNLLTPEERESFAEGWSPNRNARFGLLARSRMLEDAANPVPIRVIRAKSRAMVSN